MLLMDRAKRLLVPYFSYNLLFFTLLVILQLFNFETFFYGSQLSYFYSEFNILMVICAPLAGLGWFLWTLFETNICSAVIIKIFQKYRISYLFLCLPMIALFFFGVTITYPLYHPFTYSLSYLLPRITPAFDINFVAIPYFLLGFLAQYYEVFKRKQLILYLTPILMFVVYFLAWRHDAHVYFVFRDLKQWSYSIPVSFAAIGCLFSFSVLAESFRWLRNLLFFIGKRTLPIMCLHLLTFKITYLLLYVIGVCPATLVSSGPLPQTEYFWIALTILSIGICLVISILMENNRYLRFLFLGLSDAETVRKKGTKIFVWLVLVLYVGIFLFVWNRGYFDYEGLKMMIGY